MSEPIPHPDKTVARLLALALAIFAIGTVAKAADAPGGTEALGWLTLTCLLAFLSGLGAIYRTRWWG